MSFCGAGGLGTAWFALCAMLKSVNIHQKYKNIPTKTGMYNLIRLLSN